MTTTKRTSKLNPDKASKQVMAQTTREKVESAQESLEYLERMSDWVKPTSI